MRCPPLSTRQSGPEVVVAGEGHPLDVRQIRIVEGLRPGESYRLTMFGIRNHRGLRTAYRLVVSAGAARGERRPPRRWLRFVPAAVVIDAGRAHAVGVQGFCERESRRPLHGIRGCPHGAVEPGCGRHLREERAP